MSQIFTVGGGPSRWVRLAIIAVVFGLLVGPIGGSLPAFAAPKAQKCSEKYEITRESPQTSDDLTNRIEELQDTVLSYEYENPAEKFRGMEPPRKGVLGDYGTNTKALRVGDRAHLYTAWNRYLDRKEREGKNALPWGKWLNRYIPNMGNANRGAAYEELIVKTLGLGGDDWYCQDRPRGTNIDRVFDAVNHKWKKALELKSGCGHDRTQLMKDQQAGYGTQYICGRQPTHATEQALVKAKLPKPAVIAATHQVINPGRTAGPGSHVFNPKGPSTGSLNETVAGSGDNAEEAHKVQDAHRGLANLSGHPDEAPDAPGGIDFATMELRYVAESPDGSGFSYAFKANNNPAEAESPSYGGLRAARLSSDALFTWLALPKSAFWVNLNPDEPDRIIDRRLGRTDAGRVLLEADLAMKRSAAWRTLPTHPAGKRLWRSLRPTDSPPCLGTTRLWIVPKPASVREVNGQLFILDAPLRVRAEPITLKTPDPGQRCRASEADRQHNFAMFRRYVVPGVEEAVNTSPKYADLRRVYYSRVAAEWIRERNASQPNEYAKVIGSQDVSKWPARTKPSPKDIYREYLKSYKNGDYTFTRHYEKDGHKAAVTHFLGGVNFGKSPRKPLDAETFNKKYPALPDTVKAARYAPTGDLTSDLTWLGSASGGRESNPSPTAEPTTTQPTTTTQPPASPDSGSPLAKTGPPVLRILGVGLLLLATGSGLLAWMRRRRLAASRE